MVFFQRNTAMFAKSTSKSDPPAVVKNIPTLVVEAEAPRFAEPILVEPPAVAKTT
jgi:hypothetical protein